MTDHMDEALDLFKRVWNRKDLDTETQIEQVHAALSAAYERGRQESAPAIPAGWKLVPLEPTEAMMMHFAGTSIGKLPAEKRERELEAYRAMLAAAPEAGQ